MNPEESEMEEKKRLAKESAEKTGDFHASQERAARAATLSMGEVYEKLNGAAKVEADEIALRAYILAYSGVLGIHMTLTVPVLEAMLCLMSSLPIDTGLELYKNAKYNEFNCKLSAIRLKLMRENQKRAEAAMPKLCTGEIPPGPVV